MEYRNRKIETIPILHDSNFSYDTGSVKPISREIQMIQVGPAKSNMDNLNSQTIQIHTEITLLSL